MNISVIMMLAFAATAVTSPSSEFISQAPSTAGIPALPESAQQQLKSLGIRIAVPTYIPPGYRWQTVVTEPCPAGARVDSNGVCRFRPGYSIVYSNPQNNSCFVVEATGGGVGGVASDFAHSFNAPLFAGQTSISFGGLRMAANPKKAIASDLRRTYDVVYGDWLGTSPFYRVSTFYPRSVKACTTPRGLTPLEAQKVTVSLRWLF
jgi:hypothetical protein